MSIDRNRLRTVIRRLEAEGPRYEVAALLELLKMGAVPRLYEGLPPEKFTPEMTAEWYAGQALDLLEKRRDHAEPRVGSFHMQSLFNVLDKFVPAEESACPDEPSKLKGQP